MVEQLKRLGPVEGPWEMTRIHRAHGLHALASDQFQQAAQVMVEQERRSQMAFGRPWPRFSLSKFQRPPAGRSPSINRPVRSRMVR